MSNIPVAKVERTASHPAWTPVSVDGSVITGAMLGDAQAFGIGTADKAVGGNTFQGRLRPDDHHQRLRHGRHDEDTRATETTRTQMRSVDFEVPGARQLSFVVPTGWEWMAKFFQTVFRDAAKRPMTIVDTYAPACRSRNSSSSDR